MNGNIFATRNCIFVKLFHYCCAKMKLLKP
jgi:hypothetical protein